VRSVDQKNRRDHSDQIDRIDETDRIDQKDQMDQPPTWLPVRVPPNGLLLKMPYRFNRSHQLHVRNRLCALCDSFILQDRHKEPAMNGTSGFQEVRSSPHDHVRIGSCTSNSLGWKRFLTPSRCSHLPITCVSVPARAPASIRKSSWHHLRIHDATVLSTGISRSENRF
jgi:hypothetical protein